MTKAEAIETIKANYPPENYTMLREALDMAIKALKPDCKTAERNPISGKCYGYGRGEYDDESIEECQNCPQYDSYGIE